MNQIHALISTAYSLLPCYLQVCSVDFRHRYRLSPLRTRAQFAYFHSAQHDAMPSLADKLKKPFVDMKQKMKEKKKAKKEVKDTVVQCFSQVSFWTAFRKRCKGVDSECGLSHESSRTLKTNHILQETTEEKKNGEVEASAATETQHEESKATENGEMHSLHFI